MSVHSPQSYTGRLASYCASLRYDDIPTDVIGKAKLCLLDAIGTMLAGSTSTLATAVSRVATRFEEAEIATLLGTANRSSPTAAALVNGTLLDIFDHEDGWRFGNNHPSVVIPAALAVAEWKGSTGRELLAAVVAGYETTNRVAHAIAPMHLAAGYLPTGTAGTLGAAAAVGRLLAQDADTMAGALSTASYILPVSTAETLWCGYSGKPLHAGYAAKLGLEAALLAAEGFAGCPIEGTEHNGKGWLEITTGKAHFERLTDRLGEHYTLRDVYFKSIPACRHVHGTAEAMVKLVKDQPLDPEAVEEIVVSTYSLGAAKVNLYTDASSTVAAAQMSAPFVAAAALLDGTVGMAQFSSDRIRDPALLALSRKVKVRSDPAIDAVYPQVTPTRVDVTMRDGQRLRMQVDMPKGDPREPMSEDELIGKFRASAGAVLSERGVAELERLILQTEEQAPLNALMQAARDLK